MGRVFFKKGVINKIIAKIIVVISFRTSLTLFTSNYKEVKRTFIKEGSKAPLNLLSSTYNRVKNNSKIGAILGKEGVASSGLH